MVCVVNGLVVGLGVLVVLLCDVIVMVDMVTILDLYVKVGIVVGDGGMVIWLMVFGLVWVK